MTTLLYLSAQPDEPYFHWQVEVMIHNFVKVGIDPTCINVVFGHFDSPTEAYFDLQRRYPLVKFYNYLRQIHHFEYVSIVRPDILEQHFTQYQELSNTLIFYHDSDIIFRELPDFEQLANDDYWYVSDTISYIGASYIKSKSIDLFVQMCNIVGIDSKLVEECEQHSGGAQYLMKGCTAEFWRKVRIDCINLYDYMSDIEKCDRHTLTVDALTYYHPIQKWTADMWSVLWNIWLLDAETRITKELDFSWATSSQEEYERCSIMHNAGATTRDDGLFYKGEFINSSPFDADLSYVKSNCASYAYTQSILYAKEQRQLLGVM
jgi:hypothetical protein